jgi:ATP-dependent Clp protease ATP-binding subunit ClpC
MFEKFTERARQVVVAAQDEARALKHNYIGTEHLLLGLLRVEDGQAARVLDSLGLTVEAVREQVGRIVGVGEEELLSGQIPFTPRAKKVLELSLREALALGHNYIGTEHVLLGVARENEGVAARILLDFGVDAERIREEVVRTLGLPKGSVAPSEPGFGYRLRRGRRGPAWPPPTMRWEYRVLDASDDDLAAELNKLGQEGWELVLRLDDGRLIFKRPLP